MQQSSPVFVPIERGLSINSESSRMRERCGTVNCSYRSPTSQSSQFSGVSPFSLFDGAIEEGVCCRMSRRESFNARKVNSVSKVKQLTLCKGSVMPNGNVSDLTTATYEGIDCGDSTLGDELCRQNSMEHEEADATLIHEESIRPSALIDDEKVAMYHALNLARMDPPEELKRRQSLYCRRLSDKRVALERKFSELGYWNYYDGASGRGKRRRWCHGRSVETIRMQLHSFHDEYQRLKASGAHEQELCFVLQHIDSFKIKLHDAEAEEAEHRIECEKMDGCKASKFSALPIINGRYALESLLGKGGSAEVWRAYDRITGTYCAMKIHTLNKQIADREFQMQKRAVNHPGVAKVLNTSVVPFVYDDGYFGAIVLELADTDLKAELCRGTLDEHRAKGLIKKLLEVLMYLQREVHMCHMDLKPANILLNSSGELKLTDFHLARSLDAPIRPNAEEGSVSYLPPEVFLPGFMSYDHSKVDIYAVGVIFYQMFYGLDKHPILPTQNARGFHMVQDFMRSADRNHFQPRFPQGPTISEAAKTFIAKCLAPIPTLRPIAKDLLDDPFLG